jgi:zinc protease
VYTLEVCQKEIKKPYNFRDLALKNSFMKNEKFKTKVKKAIVFWMIPTVTYSQIDEVRQLNLLGKILEERTLKLIREKLGIAYSPYASHDFNDDYENFCYLSFYADIEPQNIDTTQKALESIVKEAYEKGINKADLESVRKPLLNKIQDYVKTNEYWLDRVLVNSVANPIKIKHASTFLKSYESITVDQVNAMIKKYLILDKKSVYILQAVPEDTK